MGIWFYFVPFDPEIKDSDKCGTGSYFDSLNAARNWALSPQGDGRPYDARVQKDKRGRKLKRLLAVKILNVHHELVAVIGHTFSLRKVRLNQGGYDDSGKYWGTGMPLYHYDDGGDISDYVRSLDRWDAMYQIDHLYPGAQFR